MDFLCCKVFDRAVVIILVSLLRGVVDGMRKILFASIMAVFFLSGCISLFSPWNWTVKVRGSFQFSSPVAGQNGKIYAATSEDLYAFTGTGTASVVYSIGAGEWFSCDPSIDENGDIYIGTTGGRLLKISPTGNLIWSFPDQQRQDDWTVRGDPSFDNAGNVYYGDANGTLYCLTPDGTELWSFDTGKEIWSKPAIDNDGTAYFGTLVTGSNEKHRLYAVKDGLSVWSVETLGSSAGFYSSPALGDGGNIYAASHDGYLYSIDSEDGSINWSLQVAPAFTGGDSGIASSPVVASDGTIYLCTNEGNLYSVSPGGEILWSRALKTTIFSTPVISSEGLIYLVDWHEARLFVLSTAGDISKKPGGGSNSGGSPLMTADGTLYFLSTLNDIGTWSQLVSFKTNGEPSGEWPMFGFDQRRSGYSK
jgi:outer membrane protein assembly factor BamB